MYQLRLDCARMGASWQNILNLSMLMGQTAARVTMWQCKVTANLSCSAPGGFHFH